MPFLTEELWQRLATGARRPAEVDRARAAIRSTAQELADPEAEREIAILQEIVTLARTLRAEAKLDPKQQLDGALYSRSAALDDRAAPRRRPSRSSPT